MFQEGVICMSSSRGDHLSADLILVSKMPVDQPPVPIVLIYFVSRCATEYAQFQESSFSCFFKEVMI